MGGEGSGHDDESCQEHVRLNKTTPGFGSEIPDSDDGRGWRAFRGDQVEPRLHVEV